MSAVTQVSEKSEEKSDQPCPEGSPAYDLPEKPLVSIRPSRGWVAINLHELWAYRELLFFLTWRDIKVRYKQTVLGAAWAVIQPLFMMLVFTLFFGTLAGMPSDGIPYPLFAFAGLLPWTFFANALTNSSNSLVGSANLVTKIYFPRMIIPAATVFAGLIDLTIALGVLGSLMIWYGTIPHWEILLLPYLVLLLSILATGVGLWMSALNVKYRDIRYALPFVVQLWMFATPIIYPASMVPNEWRWILMCNPLMGIVEGFRSVLFIRPIDWASLGLASIITCALIVTAAYEFRRMEKHFADLI